MHFKILLQSFIICFVPLFLLAQKPKNFNPQGDTSLPEVLISATKFPEKKKFIAQKVEVITKEKIRNSNSQNTGDLLQSTGNVFVQKSQQGGSSPVIRGFEASRILMVVDGIRMNNAIYRSGHLQNVITVDQNTLERAEVVFGAGSTLHGSDALGGVVTFKTLDPKTFNGTKPTKITGNALARYASVNKEKTTHADINIGGKKWAVLLSGTYSDFGDLKMGKQYPDKYPNFGRRSFYVDRINNVDSIVRNSNDRIQKFSGYKQWDLMSKILYAPSEKTSHLVNIQISNSSNVPRYDRLQDLRNGNLRFADWYYGPQKRNLYAYHFDTKLAGFFQSLRFIASHQQIEESRIQRDRNNLVRQNRIEKVAVTGLALDAKKNWQQHELHTGFDVQLNDVQSKAFGKNIVSGVISKLDTRYPEENTFNSLGIYAQHIYKFKDAKFILNGGIRWQTYQLKSTIIDQSTGLRPNTNIKQQNMGLSGNIGLVYLPKENWRITAGVASGFRAPNVDDLAKIFESSTASLQIVVPNENLSPEYTFTPEIGITHRLSNWLKLEATGFYTFFTNAIVKDKFKVNGEDSIVFNGIKYQLLASQNIASARLSGFSANISITPSPNLEIYSTINFTKGTYQRSNGTKVPLDHIPPVFGKTAIKYQQKKWSAEIWSMYNGWKRTKDYNPDGEDNAQYATLDGMPSWVTFNIRSQWRINQYLQLQIALENISDRNYRVFASGFSAAGRNLLLAIRTNF